METKFSILKAPCSKEVIGQMVRVEQMTLIDFPLPYDHLNRSILSNTEAASAFNLEWHNADKNTFFAIAEEESRIIGFAMGFKVNIGTAPGFLRGIGAQDMCGDTYFYISTLAVHPLNQKNGIGTKLTEQLVGTQSCEKALLWVKNGSVISKLIIKMGGESANRTCGGHYMTLPIKT